MGLIQHHLSYTTNRREQRIVYFYPLVSFRQHFLFVCLFLYPEIEDNNTPNVLYCLVLSLWCLLVSSHGASLPLLGMDDVIQTASASDPIPWMVSLSACSSVGNSADADADADADAAPFKLPTHNFPFLGA